MTLSYTEAASAGWTFQKTGFHLFPTAKAGYAAIYRCYRAANADHFLSSSSNCEGFSTEEIVGRASMGPASGLVPLYRFYNSSIKDHLETIDLNEGTSNGYTNEGPLGYVQR